LLAKKEQASIYRSFSPVSGAKIFWKWNIAKQQRKNYHCICRKLFSM